MERPEIGRRISLRHHDAGGGQAELVGYVVTCDADRLRVLDRRGGESELAWKDVLAWRPVGVARGRDPLRTALADLDQLAAAAGANGRCFVVRLSSLLDPRPVVDFGWAGPNLPTLQGEWATTGATEDLLAQAWWAARRDARNLQVRVSDPAAAAELPALGFQERTAPGPA